MKYLRKNHKYKKTLFLEKLQIAINPSKCFHPLSSHLWAQFNYFYENSWKLLCMKFHSTINEVISEFTTSILSFRALYIAPLTKVWALDLAPYVWNSTVPLMKSTVNSRQTYFLSGHWTVRPLPKCKHRIYPHATVQFQIWDNLTNVGNKA
jgi:hypothetical protein